MSQTVIQIKHVTNRFGSTLIHDDISLDIKRGEIIGIVGGSGSGKTILLKSILGLHHSTSGTITVLGQERGSLNNEAGADSRWGIMFQSGALFSSLTVEENIQVPMKEVAQIPPSLIQDLTYLKLAMVGLEADTGKKYPAQLSGGMTKRVALARALAIDPEILFLDEPTAGLDPIAAAAFDKLIQTLQKNLDLTVVMVTHDLDTLKTVCDRVAVLVDRRIIVGTLSEVRSNPHPWIQEYFHSRGETGRSSAPKGKTH